MSGFKVKLDPEQSEYVRHNITGLSQSLDIPQEALANFANVLRIMKRLRSPGGCPWDKEQTHRSLIKNVLEEAYEVADAISAEDDDELREELGDLLMQVVFQADIAEERNAFDFAEVAQTLTNKLVLRHPHVFGEMRASTAEDALKSWNNAKNQEGSSNCDPNSIPKGMAALLRARKVQEKAARAGFDWNDVNGPMNKLREEVEELNQAISSGNKEKMNEELGDLLFAVVNVARFIGCCPEVALTEAIQKFLSRYNHIVKRLSEQGKTPQSSNLAEMDVYWEEAKRLE